MTWHLRRLLLGAIALLGAGGCSCGIGADPNGARSASGVVEADGTVRFTPIEHGITELFPIPVRESADTTEMITGASFTGSGAAAFKVLSPLPISVPNGQDVPVVVEFAPPSAGTFEAQLMLQTAKMGTSEISLVGTGL